MPAFVAFEILTEVQKALSSVLAWSTAISP